MKNKSIVFIVIISIFFGTAVQASTSSERGKYNQNLDTQKKLDQKVSSKKRAAVKITKEYKNKAADLRAYFVKQVSECTKARDKKLKEIKDKINTLSAAKANAENELLQAQKNNDNKKVDELGALIAQYEKDIRNLNTDYKEDKKLYNSTIKALNLKIETIDKNPKEYVKKINKKINSILGDIKKYSKEIEINGENKKYKTANSYFSNLTKSKNRLIRQYAELYNAYKTKISLLPQK